MKHDGVNYSDTIFTWARSQLQNNTLMPDSQKDLQIEIQ